ncbi:MAG: DUF192 domain-containing protein [Planctomycetota bacterium]
MASKITSRSSLFGNSADDAQFTVGVDGWNKPLANFVTVANTFWTRLCGLQFRLPLRRGHGLLLYPAGSIHTFWMRGPIDVLWLDRNATVLRNSHAVPPWRMRKAPPETFAVLELGAGTAADVEIGATLYRRDDRNKMQ